MNFEKYTERERGFVQSAQSLALREGHQQFTPEHLLKVLLDDPTGGVRDPQLHYDGQKILFSYRKGGEHVFHLYELNIDGSGLNQLTAGPAAQLEPTFSDPSVDTSGVGGTLTGNALALAAVRATLSTTLLQADFDRMIPLATSWNFPGLIEEKANKAPKKQSIRVIISP